MEAVKLDASSHIASELADDAVILSWPLYEMRRARASTSYALLPHAGQAPAGMRWANVFAHRRELIRPGVSKIVTPNNDTLYSVAWLDLTAGPLVIEVPAMAGRYHVLGLLDQLTNPFAHVGTRNHGDGPNTVLVSGPEFQGPVPERFRAPGLHLRSSTRWVWIIGRILVTDEKDLAAVHVLQDGLGIRALDDDRTAATPFDPGCDPDRPVDAAHFAFQVNAALIDCARITALDWDRVGKFQPLGIGPGLVPDPAQLASLESAIQRVKAHLQVPRATLGANQWQSFPILGTTFGQDELLRAHVALQYIGMVESEEAIYPMTWHDAAAERLHGNSHYELHFEAGSLPPAEAFWSLTLYESTTCRLVENQLGRYAIGDRTPELKYEPDGGLRIHVSHHAPPKGAGVNWLPAPLDFFHLCLRAYLPSPEMLNGHYQIPAVRRLTEPRATAPVKSVTSQV